jgi:hypothetical protein
VEQEMKTDEDELKEDLYMLATMIAIYTNPHMYPFDALSKLPEAERLSELEDLKYMMSEMIG